MITREDKVVQSVEDLIFDGLIARGYPVERDLGVQAIQAGAVYQANTKVVYMDAFPWGRFTGQLDMNYISSGFNFDDGGQQAELGSTLKRRLYTIEFFCFGTTPKWAENLANALTSIIDAVDPTIPLKDVGGTGAVIDALIVEPGGAQARRVTVANPRPWEENLWLAQFKVTDEYYAPV